MAHISDVSPLDKNFFRIGEFFLAISTEMERGTIRLRQNEERVWSSIAFSGEVDFRFAEENASAQKTPSRAS